MIDRQAVDLAARRSSTYWLLSRLVLEPPTSSFMAELRPVFSAQRVDAPLAPQVDAMSRAIDEASGDEAACEALRIEHTRLFGGISQAYWAPPPYESVVLEERLPGDASAAVAAAYAEAGMSHPAPDTGPPDHLGAELRFLALLCHEQCTAMSAGDAALALNWLERQRAFLDDHVLLWLPQHCGRIATFAATLYHRAMCELIANACRLDREDIEVLQARTCSADIAATR